MLVSIQRPTLRYNSTKRIYPCMLARKVNLTILLYHSTMCNSIQIAYSGYIHEYPVLSLTELSHILVILKGVTPDSFGYMMEHQGVESIGFYMGNATTEQVEAIFQGLSYNTSLHELDLPRTRSPVDMSILSASLTVNNTLRDLTLSCDLDDHAMEHLSAGMRANRSVTRLKLHCRITDTGVQHLAAMLAVNATLQIIYLSYATSITDNGVSHLSRALQHNSSVTELNLSYNESITNTGAVALGEMLRVNKSLRELNLCGTSVGEEGATALMEGLQHNQVLNKLWLPRGLKEYCKNHKLYGSVKRKIMFGSYLTKLFKWQ